MSRIEVIKQDTELSNLFLKEYEIIERITPFCNSTDREVESLYSLSVNGLWTLRIKVKKDESRKN